MGTLNNLVNELTNNHEMIALEKAEQLRIKSDELESLMRTCDKIYNGNDATFLTKCIAETIENYKDDLQTPIDCFQQFLENYKGL